MDIAPLIIWAAGITTLLNLANMLWTLFSGPARKLGQRVGEAETRLSEVDRRAERHATQIAALQQTLATMPGHTELHKLQLTLVDMGGNLKEMRAVMEGNAKVMARLEAVVTRHEDHLLDGNKR